MIAHEAFAPIRGVYRIHQAAADSFWLYLQNVGPNGSLRSASRVVFFATSREQMNNWIQSRNEESCFLL